MRSHGDLVSDRSGFRQETRLRPEVRASALARWRSRSRCHGSGFRCPSRKPCSVGLSGSDQLTCGSFSTPTWPSGSASASSTRRSRTPRCPSCRRRRRGSPARRRSGELHADRRRPGAARSRRAGAAPGRPAQQARRDHRCGIADGEAGATPLGSTAGCAPGALAGGARDAGRAAFARRAVAHRYASW